MNPQEAGDREEQPAAAVQAEPQEPQVAVSAPEPAKTAEPIADAPAAPSELEQRVAAIERKLEHHGIVGENS